MTNNGNNGSAPAVKRRVIGVKLQRMLPSISRAHRAIQAHQAVTGDAFIEYLSPRQAARMSANATPLELEALKAKRMTIAALRRFELLRREQQPLSDAQDRPLHPTRRRRRSGGASSSLPSRQNRSA